MKSAVRRHTSKNVSSICLSRTACVFSKVSSETSYSPLDRSDELLLQLDAILVCRLSECMQQLASSSFLRAILLQVHH